MFHCHVLLHARMGMIAMIVYRGIQTPYTWLALGQRHGVGAVVAWRRWLTSEGMQHEDTKALRTHEGDWWGLLLRERLSG